MLNKIEECAASDHISNEETMKVLEDAQHGKDLIKDKEAEVITKKLGLFSIVRIKRA